HVRFWESLGVKSPWATQPSIAHGSAAPEAFATALNDIINSFIATGNVDKAWNSIIEAAEENL
ncbi:MAG: hypothetical protein ACP5D6_10750, partial [Kosmotogaceae bacterium]